jgi:preprotein translocase subunit SecG
MLLYYAVSTVHIIVCVILVLVVLLQSGRGADLAGAFGGGATQTAFGSRGPASFLSKMTTIAAVVFMLTSLGLSLITTSRPEVKSILETTRQKNAQKQPANKAPAKAPVAAPTPDQIRKQVEEEVQKQKQKQAVPTPTPAPPKQQPAK